VLDGDGKQVGTLNYMSSPKPFIEGLEKMKKKA